jgi:hypothetical protein
LKQNKDDKSSSFEIETSGIDADDDDSDNKKSSSSIEGSRVQKH